MSEARGAPDLPAQRGLYWLPAALVVVGAGVVVVGTFFLPWVVGYVTHGRTGDSQLYAGIAFLGASVVGGVLGLMMLPRGSNARLALVAILLALLVGWLIFIDYEAFVRRVARMTSGAYTPGPGGLAWDPSAGWKVVVGPGPYVAGVGVMIWIIGALVGLPRHGLALASHGASTSKPPPGP